MLRLGKLGAMNRPPPAACLLVAVLGVCLSAGSAHAYDFVVAQDGSGDFTTVQAAITAVPDRRPGRTTIFIKAGTYNEKITVPTTKPRLTLIGENRDTTIITSDDYTAVRGVDVYDTLTCYVQAKDFGARNLTFANTAGDVGQGTFALWIEGNRAHFKNCALLGYQDTLYTSGHYAYFRRCFIEGAVDFIFGPSTALFQGCAIHCLDYGYITAADTPEGRPYGLVFKGCTIYGDAPVGSVYLGRAYGDYANVAYVDCVMDDEIEPEGWDDFDDAAKQATTRFVEDDDTGPGADVADRVDWSYQLTAAADANYSLNTVFGLTPAVGNMLVAVTPWYDDF